MDKEELHKKTEQADEIGLSDSSDNVVWTENLEYVRYYVNEGFVCSKEELPIKEEGPTTSSGGADKVLVQDPILSPPDGFINEAFEDRPQTLDDNTINNNNNLHPTNGTVPQAHDAASAICPISENQISKLVKNDNGEVAVDLETKEKKWKVNSVGWDRTRTAIFLGLFLAFDAWAAIFYCIKNDIVGDIFNDQPD
ncbi:uncharacterized protein LOC126845022 [Adelges cooleyi]|uniref:uncharacterized protein LOC126845022 n=1 Tax=Adelges cooleyi TaxID=133065 RepID=UPI0021805415|nr:uncharacterized protein LOC126845022 [Adelges cooleyi]